MEKYRIFWIWDSLGRIVGGFGGLFLEDVWGRSKLFLIQFWRIFGRFFDVFLFDFFRLDFLWLDFFRWDFFPYNTVVYFLIFSIREPQSP